MCFKTLNFQEILKNAEAEYVADAGLGNNNEEKALMLGAAGLHLELNIQVVVIGMKY